MVIYKSQNYWCILLYSVDTLGSVTKKTYHCKVLHSRDFAMTIFSRVIPLKYAVLWSPCCQIGLETRGAFL